MFVKICGLTRLEDAEAAVTAGADAIGFVFWPRSPRYIAVDRARAIIDRLPPAVDRVGVFVNQSAAEVNDIARRAGLTMVQLHGDETPAAAAAIERPVIKAVTLRPEESIERWPEDVLLLVDAHDPERRGGTGRRANWDEAAVLAATRRVLLAGGLGPENVSEAIARVRPYGIDVSSGVEAAPGIKDPALLTALFETIHVTDYR